MLKYGLELNKYGLELNATVNWPPAAGQAFIRSGIPHQAPPQCTWHSCFNLSRCAVPVAVYIYQDFKRHTPMGEMLGQEPNISSPHHPLAMVRVKTPEQACILIGSLDVAMDDEQQEKARWRRGENHILFFRGDDTLLKRMKRRSSTGWSRLGLAMVATDNWVRQEYRTGFDFAWPLTTGQRVARDGNTAALRKVPALSRSFFLTFKGTIYSGRGSNRMLLLSMHDPAEGIQVIGRCQQNESKFCSELKLQPHTPNSNDSIRNNLTAPSYDELLNSTFCLVPGGAHPGTVRLAEVMSVGCIPVLVGDDYVPPFASLIDWKSIAFDFCASCTQHIVPTLRAVSARSAEKMRHGVLKAHAQYFQSESHRWAGVAEMLSYRLGHRAFSE